ncbi:hypothetical protein MPER_12139 [Moniliophthora perniciosa FA553]|nr:hypothetical protein MPER_12139 [Moniliophthora perniciosa FA553]
MLVWRLIHIAMYAEVDHAKVSLGSVEYDATRLVLSQRIFCHPNCLPLLPTWGHGVQEMVELGIITFVPRFRIMGYYYFVPCIVDNYRLEFLGVKDDPEQLLAWRKEKEDEYRKLREASSENDLILRSGIDPIHLLHSTTSSVESGTNGRPLNAK